MSYLEGTRFQKSLQTMIQNTGSNTVILAPAGIQKTSHSTEINWNSELTASNKELVALINYTSFSWCSGLSETDRQYRQW